MNAKTACLLDGPIDVRLKLSVVWASILFCYLYGDFFGLYRSGKLERMLGGNGPFGAVTQESLLAVAVTMAVPSVMVCLALLLRPAFNRWLNIVVASIFIIFVAATLRKGAWHFYIFLSAVEVLLKATIIWLAWRWPRRSVEFSPYPSSGAALVSAMHNRSD